VGEEKEEEGGWEDEVVAHFGCVMCVWCECVVCGVV